MGSIILATLTEVYRNPLTRASLLVVSLLTFNEAVRAASGNITGIWANEGGDKVAQEELRVTNHRENATGYVRNKAWNGQAVTLMGASNEVVSFNLVLEDGGLSPATNVTVQFNTLTGPDNFQIKSMPAVSNGVFQWVNRPIELFYARYVQIKGLSYFGYGKWDERAVPVRFQRSWVGTGYGYGTWNNRPDHDKFYPDALVPLELVNAFNINAQNNQSIWSDIYIPKSTPAGLYHGSVLISEDGRLTHTVPVQLTVRNFSLPDTPTVKTMIQLDTIDIAKRYVVGWGGYANWQTPEGQRAQTITDRYFELFHRHKLSLIGQNECPTFDHPCDSSLPRLTGSLYTPNNGYDGPGVNKGTGIFSIGTYGTWGNPQYAVPEWKYDKSRFWLHTDAYVSWFETNLPLVDYHLFLEDEPQPQDYGTVDTWAQWIKANPGPGQRMKSVVTHSFVLAKDDMPDVDISIMPAGMGNCPNNANTCDSPTVQQAVADLYRTGNHQLWAYNDGRPGVGTADTEDDGISMRTIPWAQYKKKIERWFYWYANVNNPTDWYAQAVTWGDIMYTDQVIGQTGNDGTSNGNGLLVYPGSTVYPNQTNYGVDGPVASLRMKEWRRGIQDTDYLALAAAYDPSAVNRIINQVIPLVLWEYPTNDPGYFTGGGPSWSSDPDVWEGARDQLAQIIADHCAIASATTEVSSPCTLQAPASVAPTSAPDPVPPPVTVSNPVPAPSPGALSPAPLHFVPLSCRLVDTRTPNGAFGAPYIGRDQSRTFTFTNNTQCIVPVSAEAFALNITVVPHGALSYLTLWPTGTSRPNVSNLNSYDSRTKANAAIVPAGLNGSVDVYATNDTDLVIDISGYFIKAAGDSTGLTFHSLTPCRIVDTRTGSGALGGPFIAGNTQRSFPFLQANCGVPSTARAYSLNYTAVPHQGLAWLSAWPTDQLTSQSSILNATTSAITANAAITSTGTDGSVTVYVHDDSDVVVDINGYFAAADVGGMSFYAVAPCRAFDSRITENPDPLQGTLSLDFTTAGCQIPVSAKAIVLNTTVVPSGRLNFVTLWAAGQNQPMVSTLNASDGQVTSNLAIVPATNGALSSFMTDPTHLIFDVTGYFQ